MGSGRRLEGLALGAAIALHAASARADGISPRTPVEWPDDTPCMTVVDRSESPLLHFPYQIPREDTEVDPDELPGSRRHQFFAFCRDHVHGQHPSWVSLADVEAWNAWLAGQGEAPWEPSPAEILETNDEYADCFARITPDDQRRAILFAEAHEGVTWDTTGLSAGPHVVSGYTWHPPLGIWSRRPGVVHVVDGPDLSAVPPAAALMNREEHMFAADGLVLTGCARALPGSILRGSWALAEELEPPAWTQFAADVPLAGEAIELPFAPPPEAIGQYVYLQVELTDPMGRRFAAYGLQRVAVLPGSAACDDEPSGPSCTGGVDPTTGGTADETTSDSGTGEAAPETGPGGETSVGCGCRSAGAPAGWLVLALARRRRSRRR
jgi:hypothetical protein